MTIPYPRATLTALLAAGALALSACGTVSSGSTPAKTSPSSSGTSGPSLGWTSAPGPKATTTVNGDTVKVDVGGGQTVTVNRSAPLKIAYLVQGQTNSYLQATIAGAQAAAKSLGVKLTVFDGGFVAATQKAQLQNILAGKQYNAIIALTVDGSGLCGTLTQTAPAQNILVLPLIQTICNNATEPITKAWSPGTLAAVVGGGTVDFYQAWANHIASSLTKPTKAVYVTGPSSLGTVQAAVKALQEAAAKYPNFQLVDIKYTDFSAAQALAATQNALLAHPDTAIFLSHFTPMTTGILQALKQSGNTSVRVYDIGGNSAARGYVEAGQIVETVPYFPYTAAYCAVSMLSAAHQGTAVPRTVLNDCKPSTGSGEHPLFVTKGDVAGFTAEY